MRGFTKEIKIAITAIIAIVIIYVGIILLKGLNLFNTDKEYTVIMNNVTGLSVSSDVLANGLKIGYVKKISYNNKNQKMALTLTINQSFKMPKGTSVFVTKEMLGTAKLNLDLGANTGEMIQPGDTIYGESPVDLMAAAGEMIPQIESMLPKIDSILTSLNTLVSDPALVATIHNLEYTTSNLRTTTDRINGILNKDVPSMMSAANNAAHNVEALTATLNRVDIEGIANNANQTISNANLITNKLNTAMNSKDNSLGLLLNDNSLVLNMDSTMRNASLLLEDLRLHPKRYVHFSLFGKKDK